jgi:hypothetical protein
VSVWGRNPGDDESRPTVNVSSAWLDNFPCRSVGAIHESPLLQKDRSLRVGERRRTLLSKIIGRFKMVSAKNINLVRATSGLAVWQRNYYEHVIRNEASLNRIRQYIVDNPAQWEFDEENPGGSVHI